MGKGGDGQRIQTSNSKMSKFWGSNAQHDISLIVIIIAINTILYTCNTVRLLRQWILNVHTTKKEVVLT